MAKDPNSTDYSFELGLKKDLCRLARFGANLSDAHSCFIFLPSQTFEQSSSLPGGRKNLNADLLEIGGFHSLSSDILQRSRIEIGTGLIGWVAKHQRSIHVSPFQRDSRTLGFYSCDQQLKSFIGIPLPMYSSDSAEQPDCWGVICCDSKKSYAFSKLQGKLLEDFALEVSHNIKLNLHKRQLAPQGESWADFLKSTISLAESLGRESLEIMRVRLTNFERLEEQLGTPECIKLIAQLYRLIKQALPPQFPQWVLPNGDMLVALDAMTCSFYENRFRAICSHVSPEPAQPHFQFIRRSFADKRYRSASIDKLVSDTATADTLSKPKQGELYEFRRA